MSGASDAAVAIVTDKFRFSLACGEEAFQTVTLTFDFLSPPRSDCVDILTQCGDRRRFHEGQTPERICELLSPVDDPERCIPLHRYLSESQRAASLVFLSCSLNPADR